MSTVSLRSELTALISREDNTSLLEVLKSILLGDPKDTLLKAKLTARSLKAEGDLADGRVSSATQVRERLASRKKK